MKPVYLAASAAGLLCSFSAAGQHLAVHSDATPNQDVICQTCDPGDPGDGGGSGSTQDVRLVSSRVKPSAGEIETVLSNGLAITIDVPLNKVFFSTSLGMVEHSLSTLLLKQAGGNATVANAMKRSLQDQVASVEGSSRLTYSSSQSLAAKPLGGLGGELALMYDGSSYAVRCNYFTYCYQRTQPLEWGSYSFSYFDGGNGGQYGSPQIPDWVEWEQRRRDHCDAAFESRFGIALGIAGAISGCGAMFAAAAPTLGLSIALGGLQCAASAAGVGYLTAKYQHESAMCNATYPGAP
jgi:hypothetical protein